MILSAEYIVKAVGGTLVKGKESNCSDGISTDTRNIKPGNLFIALEGPNFKGSDFIPDALEKGAAGILASRLPGETFIYPDWFFVRVEDTEWAMGDLANRWRCECDPYVCSVMGSSGKTTTKQMISSILSLKFNTVSTRGNFNNTIGVPLTIFEIERETEAAVLEIGMNQPGEMARLGEIVDPDILVVVNIGRAHLGMFPGQEDLINAKAEIFETLRPDCPMVINIDCTKTPFFLEKSRHDHEFITFGFSRDADFRAVRMRHCKKGYRFDLVVRGEKIVRMHLPLFGKYNILNALSAIAAAERMGVDIPVAVECLEKFRPADLRSESFECDGVRIICDCYNANPDSSAAVLGSFRGNGIEGKVIVVHGDMLELGEAAESLHRETGIVAAESGVDVLLTYGDLARFMGEEASAKGILSIHTRKHEEIVSELEKVAKPGDTVLFKGSRLMKLEVAAKEFMKRLKGDNEKGGEGE